MGVAAVNVPQLFGDSVPFPFFFFSCFTVALSKIKEYMATSQKKRKTTSSPTVGVVHPTIGSGWLHQSSSFRSFAHF